jgi:hypothetical protein
VRRKKETMKAVAQEGTAVTEHVQNVRKFPSTS